MSKVMVTGGRGHDVFTQVRALSIMHHPNELNETKELVTRSCIAVREKRLASNEIERGIGIPTIESRASNIPIDKGNCIRD